MGVPSRKRRTKPRNLMRRNRKAKAKARKEKAKRGKARMGKARMGKARMEKARQRANLREEERRQVMWMGTTLVTRRLHREAGSVELTLLPRRMSLKRRSRMLEMEAACHSDKPALQRRSRRSQNRQRLRA